MPLIFSFFLQGIRQIRIGTKLQEVGSQHQYEGWTFLHYAMAGADMSYLWDMCSELIGEIEKDELVPGQFDSPPAKKLWVEVEKEDTKVGEATGVINPSRSTTKVYTDQLPIPSDLGVPSNYLPHWESVKKDGAKGGTKQFPATAVCSVTTSYRTEPPPLPIPVVTLMWW